MIGRGVRMSLVDHSGHDRRKQYKASYKKISLFSHLLCSIRRMVMAGKRPVYVLCMQGQQRKEEMCSAHRVLPVVL